MEFKHLCFICKLESVSASKKRTSTLALERLLSSFTHVASRRSKEAHEWPSQLKHGGQAR